MPELARAIDGECRSIQPSVYYRPRLNCLLYPESIQEATTVLVNDAVYNRHFFPIVFSNCTG